MKIKNKPNLTSLNESQQMRGENQQVVGTPQNPQRIQLHQEGINRQSYQEIFVDKTKQFIFDAGFIMGNMSSKVDNKFGLRWHKNNTKNVSEFLLSIQNFLGTLEVTENDIARLKKEYNK